MNDIIRDDNKLFLRLQRQGSKYTASCSVDGRKFIPVGTADIMLKDVMAGMIACNGVPLSAALVISLECQVCRDQVNLKHRLKLCSIISTLLTVD
jgi:hypothetical protein